MHPTIQEKDVFGRKEWKKWIGEPGFRNFNFYELFTLAPENFFENLDPAFSRFLHPGFGQRVLIFKRGDRQKVWGWILREVKMSPGEKQSRTIETKVDEELLKIGFRLKRLHKNSRAIAASSFGQER
jgi:hypothetical protein